VLNFIGYEFRKVRERLFGTGKRYLHFGPSANPELTGEKIV
jgi:RNA-directed DNA polymerase